MNNRRRLIDLTAFIAVLVTGIVLVLIGVAPEALAVVVVALVGLYGAWLGVSPERNNPAPPSTEERR
jgi:hypothetical protein